MKLKTLLLLQIAYAVMGVGYNVLSYLSVASGGQPFSATAPLTGGLSLALYALCLVPGFAGYTGIYRVLMALSIVVFGYGGIIKHLLNYPDGLGVYSSMTAYVLAIGINVFGLVLNVIAVSGRFEGGGKAG
ncbi:MAG: hypothetical protein EHM32_07040 [Spirochaetales bacterium]|nr:MAG: hypothetical protein EHM32_07040 [Spirochaetales bacterium]